MSDDRFPARDDADAKAWFYLDHRADIEQWAALRADASELVERHLLILADELPELAAEFGAECYQADLETGSWPRFGLRRESWRLGGTDVAIVVEWERSRLLRAGNEWPYVGIRTGREQANEGRRLAIAEALAPLRSAEKMKKSQVWPAWRYVTPAAGSSLDPTELALEVERQMRALWTAAAPVIDAVHNQVTG